MRRTILKPRFKITTLEKDINLEWEKLRITVSLPMEDGWYENVNIHIISGNMDINGKPCMLSHFENDDEKGYAIFKREVVLPTSALYYYYFSYECNGQYRMLKKENLSGEQYVSKQECFKLAVNFSAPDWAKGANMYHVLVDRFYRSDKVKIEPISGRKLLNWPDKPVLGPDENGTWNADFYGGNLLGIVEKLDYIQSLSIDILYLSPVNYAQSNHRYDTIDYFKIDPYLGTEKDLKLLCKESHKRGMRVVLDCVFNHTGDRSIYFDRYDEYGDGVYNHGESSTYAKFYKRKWHNGKFSFCYWWGFENLPECDTTSREWQEFVTGEGGVIDWLFECEIDGIRLDVADELSDEMIFKIRQAIIRNKPDGFLFGEVWENPMRQNRGYVASGKRMHSVMNYQWADALIRYYKYQDIAKLNEKMVELLVEYPIDTLNTLMNFTSTHDISRLIEIFACDVFNKSSKWAWDLSCSNDSEFVKNHILNQDEYEYGKRILKSYLVAFAFLPGMFSIFYGDEVGMLGLHNLANRGPFPWGKEDQDMLNFMKNLMKARKLKVLKSADTRVLEICKQYFMYERYTKNEKILVIASRTHYETELHLPEGHTISEVIFKSEWSTWQKLEPYGYLVFKEKI